MRSITYGMDRRATASLAVLFLLVSHVATTGALMACSRTATRACCCAPTSCCAAPGDAEGMRSGCCSMEAPVPASTPAPLPVTVDAGPAPAPAHAPLASLFEAPPLRPAPHAPSFEVDPAESPPRYQLIHAYLI